MPAPPAVLFDPPPPEPPSPPVLPLSDPPPPPPVDVTAVISGPLNVVSPPFRPLAGVASAPRPPAPIVIVYVVALTGIADSKPVSYTHLTLPTNREV